MKQVSVKPKAEAKKPVTPPTPRPADGMNARQRRNAKQREQFLASPEFAAIAEQMVTRWPSIFRVDHEQVKPLAIGIFDELQAALPEFTPNHIRQTLRQWINDHRFQYWDVIIAGGPRYDLEGNPKGEVTAEQQAIAREQKEAWIKKGAEIRRKRAEAEQVAVA